MITVRRASERRHDQKRPQEVWKTFHSANPLAPFVDHFGTLEVLNEERFPPGSGAPLRAHREAEIITYVREGTLNHEDSMGGSGVIHAGKFQRMTAGTGIDRSETNASKTDWAHVFQIWLRPSEAGLAPSMESEHFTATQRRGALRVVASQDGRNGSLHIHQDARIYSALLERGQHVVHELAPDRSVWLHVVHGEIGMGDARFSAGDGLGITAEPSVSFTARTAAEVILIDLGEPAASPPTNGSPA